jgi:hypothetical protein
MEQKRPRGRPKKENTLLKEAREFKQSKLPPDKPMTARIYLAGQALAGLLANQPGYARFEDIRREAYEWADKMLEEEGS